MIDYIELRVDITNCNETITDLLAGFLVEVGYESFLPDEEGLTAYIKSEEYEKSVIENIISNFPIEIRTDIKSTLVKGQDWNEEWEKNYFKPILIDDKCVIHSTFHKDVPSATYDIVIDPKMAFGTGHHSTTLLILRYLLSLDIKDKTVIDMGTGTGILAILCSMLGAKSAVGIEIDPGAYENALENVALNHVNVEILLGDAMRLAETEIVDLFIANINRNIILSDISLYAPKIKVGGTLLLSGFYENDINLISMSASMLNLELVDYKMDNEWVAVRFIKSK